MIRRRYRFRRLRRSARRWGLRILKMEGEPEQIARGVALGIFLGFVVPPGAQTVVAVGLAPILRGNPLTAAAGVWVTNPLTMPIIYPLAYAIGAFATGYPVRATAFPDEQTFWKLMISVPAVGRIGFLMMLGLLILGSLGAFVSYYITRFAVLAYRRRRSPV